MQRTSERITLAVKALPPKSTWKRTLILSLAFVMTFLAGSSAGYVYIANKQMNLNCNFQFVAPQPQRFGT